MPLPLPRPRPPRSRPELALAVSAVLAAAALLVAACGDGTVATGPDETPATTDDGDRTGDDRPPPTDGSGSTHRPTSPMLDIVDREPHPIDEVVVGADDLTLGVRYRAASEPCTGAVATVVEDRDSVTVTLETGLNPRAAAMTCIAEVIAYELTVPLDEPLGDREIVTA